MEIPRRINRWGILFNSLPRIGGTSTLYGIRFAVSMHREIFLRKFSKTY